MNQDGIKTRHPMPVRWVDTEKETAEPKILRLEDLLAILRRNLALIAICVAAAIAAATYMISNTTPQYVASAEMLLGGDDTGNRISLDLLDERALNDSALQGEIAVLQSMALLVRVVNRLDLEESPEFNPALRPPAAPTPVIDSLKNRLRAFLRPQAETVPKTAAPDITSALTRAAESGTGMLDGKGPTVDLLRRSLSISQRGTSYVVRVTASSEDPVTAAAIANAVVEEYIAFTGDRRFAAALRYTGWLETRVTELARSVEDSETAVLTERARAESDVDSSDRLAQQMEEMTTKLVNVRAELSETEARALEARKLLESGGTLAAASVLSSSVLTELNSRLADLRRERDETRRRFDEGSPQLRAIVDEMESLDAEIALEVNRVIEELETLARVQQINAEALSGSLAALERRAVDRSLSDIQINQLERIADANRRLYEDFLDRFKQSSEIQNLRRADAEVISFASAPSAPATPRIKPTLVLATAGGLMVALGLAFAMELLPKRLSTIEDVRRATNLRTFGELPVLPTMHKLPKLAALLDRDTMLGQNAQAIWRNLRLALGRNVRSVFVTGAQPGGDKSVSAIVLGQAMAKSGLNCLLVDGDVKNAHLSRHFTDGSVSGLLEVLDGEVDLHDAVHDLPELGLSFLPCHASGLDPATLFATANADTLFELMLRSYDAVIIDGPPLDSESDVVNFSVPFDTALFVLPAGQAKARQTSARVSHLSSIMANVEGAIISRRPRRSLRRV